MRHYTSSQLLFEALTDVELRGNQPPARRAKLRGAFDESLASIFELHRQLYVVENGAPLLREQTNQASVFSSDRLPSSLHRFQPANHASSEFDRHGEIRLLDRGG
jgi:hypothetical protein